MDCSAQDLPDEDVKSQMILALALQRVYVVSGV